MALILCVECASQMSDAASSCPACGAPAPASMMLASADPAGCGSCPTAERSDAFICPACGASKGHMRGGPAYGDKLKATAGVIAPAVIAAMFLPASYVVLPLALFGVYRLVRSRTEQPRA